MHGEDCNFEQKQFCVGFMDVNPIYMEEKFSVIDPHVHEHGHVCTVGHGSGKATGTDKNGKVWEKVYKSGDMWYVPEYSLHGFTSLEPHTYVLCMFAHRDEQHNIVAEHIANINSVS